MDTVLDRQSELSQLADTVRGAAAGRGALVLIGGEAGAGKTALVREFTYAIGTTPR